MASGRGMSVHLPEQAARLADRGLAVFPVVGKVPATGNGFLDAVDTRGEAVSLFRRHRNATGIGIACGASGLLIVDLDGPAAEDRWAEIIAEHGVIETLEVTTGRPDGGRHLWLRTDDPRAVNSNRLLPVHTRGRGGYCIAPPSAHPSGARYRWRTRRPIAAAPEWLLRLLEPPPPPPVGERRELRPGERLTPYGRAALEGLADHVLASAEGTRNERFHTSARRAGRLFAAGEIDEHIAHDVLCAAARSIGLDDREIEQTWRSGFQFGQQYPAARASR